MRTDGPRGVRRLAARAVRSLRLGSARAVRGAAFVTLTAVMPLLVASSLCSGDDEFPEPPTDWERIKGHSGPAWGRTDAGAVIVFGWHEGLPRVGGSLYMIREDGTGLTLLSESVGDHTWTDEGVAYDSSPAISPDGTRLLYATMRYPYQWFQIATTALEERERVLGFFGGGREHRQLMPGRQLQAERSRESQAAPAWSPDGTRIALLLAGNLHTMAADGSDLRSIAPRISGIYEPPAWSPDGTRLAFRGYERDPREVSLYVVNADGSNLTQVAEQDEEEIGPGPAWAPDGHRIAFLDHGVILRSVAVDVLSVLDLRTGTVEALSAGSFGPFVWSQDSSQIYYASIGSSDNSGNPFSESGLFAVAVAGEHTVRRVAEDVWYPMSGMSLSPDGTRLAVTVALDFYDPSREGAEGKVVLYTIATDGSDPRVLVHTGRGGALIAEGEVGR